MTFQSAQPGAGPACPLPVAIAPLRLAVAAALGVSVAGGLLPLTASAATVEEILVQERQPAIYRERDVSMTKFTEPLRDIPQSITTINSALMEDRAMMSLNDALRNIPGITLAAGEFAWQGDGPAIRGFSSRGDLFIDGMRDIGNYARDPFNLEAVEVLQGPSSMVFGRGSTGGVINQSTKQPLEDRRYRLSANLGNADTVRLTADLNQPLALGQDTAARLNMLHHEAGVPERDQAQVRRQGIAPTLSTSLGSATRMTLSYMRLDTDSRPDYGLPWLEGRPAEVPRRNFYGFLDDYMDNTAQVATLRLDHQFNSQVSLNSQVRYGRYDRESRTSEPVVPAGVRRSDDLSQVQVTRNVFEMWSRENMLQAQLNLLATLNTGTVSHHLVAGVEVSREESSPTLRFHEGVPSTSLLAPGGNFSADRSADRLITDVQADTLGAFLLNTMKLNEQWQVVAGIRWDKFDTDYRESRFAIDGEPEGEGQILANEIETSYRAALVYKPVEQGTLYLGWGTSFNPSSETLTFVSSGRGRRTENAFLRPEKNESLELGLKWDLLEERLSVDAAVFRIEKSNARVPDPENPGFNVLAGKQRVDGLSVNLTGRLSETIQAMAGYTWLDSQQLASTNPAIATGAALAYVAEHSFSSWLNWAATDKLDIGGGARYVDERLAVNAPPVLKVPAYWAFDAMAKYEWSEQLTFKLNLTNLGNRFYFDQLHPWHVIPGPGFSAILAVNVLFD